MTPFHISAMLTSLPLDFESAVRQSAALGFSHIDVVALSDRPPAHVEALADASVLVSCCPIGRDLSDAQTLDAPSVADRRAAVDAMKRQIADAALLGATHVYVVPGKDDSAEGLARFADACAMLADYAGARMMRMCVEHVPGRALPTASGALEWLDRIAHPNLFLLLDVGHCLISGEDAAAVVMRARARLGYVHFDDNDGVGDLHWPLLAGKLTEDHVRAILAALPAAGYRAPLALELNPQNGDPVSALRDGKTLLDRLTQAT